MKAMAWSVSSAVDSFDLPSGDSYSFRFEVEKAWLTCLWPMVFHDMADSVDICLVCNLAT